MKTLKLFCIATLIGSSTLVAQSLKDAIKLTTNEQFGKADDAFKGLIQAQPGNGEIYFYYGENYFANDNSEMAKKMYNKGIEVNATSPFSYIGLGKVQWYEGKQNEAKANFYKATTLSASKNATVFIEIAKVYIQAETKNLTEAFSLLSQAEKLEPKNPKIFIYTGDAYLEQNDGSKAIEYYEKAAALDPKSVEAVLRQGQLYNRSRNYPLALDFYKKASLIDSSFAPAYREKAEIYFRAGQYKNATQQYKRFFELNNDCSAKSRYSGILNQAKQYKESIDAAKEALQCDPNNAYTYRYKARSEFETGDFTNGLQSINSFFDMAVKNNALKIIPEDYEYKAKLLAKNNNDSLAVVNYKKAIELQPEKVEFYGDIAKIYYKQKKYQDAIDAYNMKIKTGKPNVNDTLGIGRAFFYLKEFKKADSVFEAVTRNRTEIPDGYLWRAKANVQLDLKNEKWLAKPFYESYLAKLKPEDLTNAQNKTNLIESYTYLGVNLINTKDNCGAKVYFKKVIELDAANANAKKFLDSAEAKKCP